MGFRISKPFIILISVIVSLAGILSFFRCGGLTRSKIETVEHPPFTIERTNKYGKRYDINTASSRDNSRSSYKLYYGEDLVSFPSSLSDNTGVSGIWKMYILKDAPQPSILVGSKAIMLVTEHENKIEVRPLSEQSSDFGSIQWLDSEMGRPGIKQEIYSSDDTGQNCILSGGRFLLINKYLVFDIATLNSYPFTLNGDYTGEYSAERPINFSPDQDKIVYLGSQYQGQYYYAIIVVNFKNNKVQVIPIDRNKFRFNQPYSLPAEWFDSYFKWVKEADSSYKLSTIERDTLLPWVGYFSGELNYSISPVKEEMLPFFVEFIQGFLNLSDSDIKLQQYSSGSNYTLQVGQNKVELRYLNDLQTVYLSDSLLDKDEEGYTAIIRKIGEAFNKELAAGNFQEFFTGY